MEAHTNNDMDPCQSLCYDSDSETRSVMSDFSVISNAASDASLDLVEKPETSNQSAEQQVSQDSASASCVSSPWGDEMATNEATQLFQRYKEPINNLRATLQDVLDTNDKDDFELMRHRFLVQLKEMADNAGVNDSSQDFIGFLQETVRTLQVENGEVLAKLNSHIRDDIDSKQQRLHEDKKILKYINDAVEDYERRLASCKDNKDLHAAEADSLRFMLLNERKSHQAARDQLEARNADLSGQLEWSASLINEAKETLVENQKIANKLEETEKKVQLLEETVKELEGLRIEKEKAQGEIEPYRWRADALELDLETQAADHEEFNLMIHGALTELHASVDKLTGENESLKFRISSDETGHQVEIEMLKAKERLFLDVNTKLREEKEELKANLEEAHQSSIAQKESQIHLLENKVRDLQKALDSSHVDVKCIREHIQLLIQGKQEAQQASEEPRLTLTLRTLMDLQASCIKWFQKDTKVLLEQTALREKHHEGQLDNCRKQCESTATEAYEKVLAELRTEMDTHLKEADKIIEDQRVDAHLTQFEYEILELQISEIERLKSIQEEKHGKLQEMYRDLHTNYYALAFDNNRYQVKNRNLENEVDELGDELEEARLLVTRLEANHYALALDIDRYQVENNNLNNKCDELRSELEEARMLVIEKVKQLFGRELAEGECDYGAICEMIENFSHWVFKRVDKLEEELALRDSTVESFLHEREDHLMQREAILSQRDAQRTDDECRIEELDRGLKSATTRLEILEEMLSDASEEERHLCQALKSVEADFARATTENDYLFRELKIAKAEIQSFKNKSSELDETLKPDTSEIDVEVLSGQWKEESMDEVVEAEKRRSDIPIYEGSDW